MIELNELKYRELQIKSRGFDIMREVEALQIRMNQLNSDKDLVISSLKELYDFANKQNQTTTSETQIVSTETQHIQSETKQSTIPETQNNIEKPIEKKITRTKNDREK